jgi:hypothetical protein
MQRAPPKVGDAKHPTQCCRPPMRADHILVQEGMQLEAADAVAGGGAGARGGVLRPCRPAGPGPACGGNAGLRAGKGW